MSGVQHHLYDNLAFIFGFEQLYGRFSTPPEFYSSVAKEPYLLVVK
jgi:hypothetical protein